MPKFGWRHFASKPADWWNPPVPGPFEKGQLDQIHQLVAERAPTTLLEIGVGRGRATAWLRGEWSYIGVEVNAQLLEDAHLRDGGPFLLGTGTHLPVKDGRFDAVVAFDVFMHIWERQGFLTECRRVLAPGGTLVINYLRRFSRGWRSYLLALIVHPLTTWKARDRRFDSQSDVRKLLLAAGFKPEFFMVNTSIPFVVARSS